MGEIGGILGIAQAQAKPLPEPASMLDAGFALSRPSGTLAVLLAVDGGWREEHGSSRHL
ncbi:hypothetical protein P4237_12640 [Pseudomonas aeruginosa]|nr:hypothetical protein [Pseudomonas aeruginosa]